MSESICTYMDEKQFYYIIFVYLGIANPLSQSFTALSYVILSIQMQIGSLKYL